MILVSWAGGAVAAILNYYDFRLTQVEDELQYERGLLRRYDGSIPLDKVQTLTVADDPLKRYFGYASLRIETAGYAPGAGENGSEAAVPLATRDRVFALANRIEPFGAPTFERPPKRVRGRYAFRYLLGVGVLVALLYAVNHVTTQALPGTAPSRWRCSPPSPPTSSGNTAATGWARTTSSPGTASSGGGSRWSRTTGFRR
ncbi:PH domain-containing protein [Haloplanus litoreus]|uniref:PH domain-containing protein n=1 Tax=Haloplanus litoreus TaxID=767515 RepID=UPI003605B1CB